MDYVIKAEAGHYNLSPIFFAQTAVDFLAYYDAFKPDLVSVVPHFLCSRAIELSLKSIHLHDMNQEEVRDDFGHDIQLSYRELPGEEKLLSVDQVRVLNQASKLYVSTRFAYIRPIDLGTALKEFPDIEELAEVARTLVEQALTSSKKAG